MHSRFLQLFTPLDKAHFGALAAQHAGRGAGVDHAIHPSHVLSRSHFSSLKDVVVTRQASHPFRLGTLDSSGPPNIAGNLLSDAIKGFFQNESVLPDTGRRKKSSSHCDLESFDVRQIATVSIGGSGGDTMIYCCRYREDSELNKRSADEDSFTSFKGRARPKPFAIPSHAGLHEPYAPSLVSPLSMSPREHVSQGEAGAILCFSPNSLSYVADLYWSKNAFLDSLEHVQEIGRTLIATDAPGEAARTGVGIHHFHRASAILTKLYEAVAQIGQDESVRFFNCGIWGVAIQPKATGAYLCQIGVAVAEHGAQYEDSLSVEGPRGLLSESDRKFVIVNFDLRQDRYGFLQLTPEAIAKRPVEPIAWYDRLPSLN